MKICPDLKWTHATHSDLLQDQNEQPRVNHSVYNSDKVGKKPSFPRRPPRLFKYRFQRG